MIVLICFVALSLAASYSPMKKFNITWVNNEVGAKNVKALNFTLTAKVDGYIALGFAKKGEFATDYVAGWYDKKKKKAVCGDFDVKTRTETKSDKKQNLDDCEGSESKDGITTIMFTRKIDTKDNSDQEFKSGDKVTVYWELSDKDGSGTKDKDLKLPNEKPDDSGDFDVDFVKTANKGVLKDKDL